MDNPDRWLFGYRLGPFIREYDAVWTDDKTWKTSWIEERELDGGGQGNAYIVSRRSDVASCNQRYFLKELKSNKDPERRSRQFREAAALLTYDHPGIPRLVESNAHQFGDTSFKLYMVTEYVDGENLHDLISNNGPMSFTHAQTLALRLVDTIAYVHAADGIHRDIKPANIVLRGSEPSDAVLVDFGLSHSLGAVNSHATELWQEVGNRFLRLPELAPNSPNKHDPRSDLTFVAGIFFYTLTGRDPAQLADERGRLPHQRDGAEAAIRAATGERAIAVLTFFDRAFAFRIEDRFLNASAMCTALNHMTSDLPDPSNPDVTFETLRAQLTAQGADQRRTQIAIMQRAGHAVEAVVGKIAVALEHKLVSVSTGWYKSDATHHWKNIGLDTPGTSTPRFRPCFDFQIVGSELVIAVFDEDRRGSEQPLWRTSAESPQLDSLEFEQAVKGVFSAGLSTVFGLAN